MSFNSLRIDQTLDWSKLNAPADDKIKVLKMTITDFDRVENIVGKGENAGYYNGPLPRIIKSRDCVEKN